MVDFEGYFTRSYSVNQTGLKLTAILLHQPYKIGISYYPPCLPSFSSLLIFSKKSPANLDVWIVGREQFSLVRLSLSISALVPRLEDQLT